MANVIIINPLEQKENAILVYLKQAGYEIKELDAYSEPAIDSKKTNLIIWYNNPTLNKTLREIKKIKEKIDSPPILIIMESKSDNDIIPFINAGVNGIITSTYTLGELKDAIRNISKNNPYLSPQIISHKLTKLIKKKHHLNQLRYPQLLNLTKREKEILKLISDEMTNAEIAEKLFVSPRTIDTHRRNLLQKIGAKNTVGLVKFAFRTKLIE